MTINQQLISNFPKNINKTGTIFSSLVASTSKNGTLEQVLQELKDYMDEWTATSDIYEQEDTMLEKTASFFSYLEQFTDETEDSFKNRISAIFTRNGSTIWGTPYNIKEVFSQYFPSGTVYIAENTNDISDNLIADGDVESETSENWTFTDCEINQDARFSGSYGFYLSSSSSTMSQTVNINCTDSTTYFLHFMLNGDIYVKISNGSQWWDNENKVWSDTECTTSISTNDWTCESLYFRTDGETENVVVEFIGVEDTETYIDYIRLFEKKPYPSFTVLVLFNGSNSGNQLALAEGDEDTDTPIPDDYENKGYFDNVYMTGASAGFASDIYTDLLDYVRGQGVKAYIDIITREYIEE